MLEVTYFEKIGIVIFSRCSLQIISVKNVSWLYLQMKMGHLREKNIE
jgi:hypothetical protein